MTSKPPRARKKSFFAYFSFSKSAVEGYYCSGIGKPITPMTLHKNLISSALSLTASLALPILATASGQQKEQNSTGQFPGIQQLPASRFQDELMRLSPTAQKRAQQILNGIHFNKQDLPSMHAHSDGSICYACRLGSQNVPASKASPPPPISEADLAKPPLRVAPFPAELFFNSRPGSPNVLWLNFEGQVITGTIWNTEVVNRETIDALPFSTDAKLEEYSASEQAIIKQIWQRVAEDYAPFDINVTTQRPAVIDNRTAVCLITSSTDRNKQPNPAPNAGGVAFVDVFGISEFITLYSPAFVYHDNLSNRADDIAEASSHEVGHNMGLSHDGLTNGTEYYGGHGSGDVSWGPIMGTGYDRSVSQWSQGEYYLANNKQDDLAIIAGKVGYRPDDHGNANDTATPLEVSAGTDISSTDPETDPNNLFPANKGVLEKSDDVDVFSFSTGRGSIVIQAKPWAMTTQTKGGNLDILLELYDDAGNLLQTSNPLDLTSAIISSVVEQGNYFLHIKNTGVGNPESAAPSARPVRCAAAAPSTSSAPISTTQPDGDSQRSIRLNASHANTVPQVPGARRGSPLPQPSASACAGCASRKRSVGRTGVAAAAGADSSAGRWSMGRRSRSVFRREVIEGRQPAEVERAAVGADDPQAAPGLDAPDARDRRAGLRAGRPHLLRARGRRGEQQLVLVAAGERALALRRRRERARGGRQRQRVPLDRRADAGALQHVAQVTEQPVGDVDARAGHAALGSR